jgi:RNA polymerase sigma-70 factor (ECF subfamily)
MEQFIYGTPILPMGGEKVNHSKRIFSTLKKDMKINSHETEMLVERAKSGDASAFEELFKRHRVRLRKAIAIRMDRRVAARVDASDVIQETYMEAFRRFPNYLKQEKLPFYTWIYWIASQKLIGVHRRHLGAEKRSVQYEAPHMPVDSSAELVSGLIGRLPSPSPELARKELAERLRMALGYLSTTERDLILWRHFENLSARDIARLLDITEAATYKRYVRAVEHLRKILKDLGASIPGR